MDSLGHFIAQGARRLRRIRRSYKNTLGLTKRYQAETGSPPLQRLKQIVPNFARTASPLNAESQKTSRLTLS